MWASPPVVKVVEGTVPVLRNDIREAVAMLNTNLPAEWQLKLAAGPAPFEDAVAVVPGELIVAIMPQLGLWPQKRELHSAGKAVVKRHVHDPCTIYGASVWVDHENQTRAERMNVLMHQLLHALGRGHADESVASIMRPRANGVEGILYPFDQAMLQAIYPASS